MTYNEANDLGGFFLDFMPDCTVDTWKRDAMPRDAHGLAPDAYWADGWYCVVTAPDGRYVRIGDAVEHDAGGLIVHPGLMATLTKMQKGAGR